VVVLLPLLWEWRQRRACARDVRAGAAAAGMALATGPGVLIYRATLGDVRFVLGNPSSWVGALLVAVVPGCLGRIFQLAVGQRARAGAVERHAYFYLVLNTFMMLIIARWSPAYRFRALAFGGLLRCDLSIVYPGGPLGILRRFRSSALHQLASPDGRGL
jgi:hypothetical protein